jgi:hypothetical protein
MNEAPDSLVGSRGFALWRLQGRSYAAAWNRRLVPQTVREPEK